jgi:hypothetical protein
VLIDSNLLLLLLVGSYDAKLIGNDGFKRIARYSVEDYQLLLRLLKWFNVAVTTPHVLTEVSNLASQLAEHHKLICFQRFAETFQKFVELNITSLSVANRDHFPRLGLTDSVIAENADDYLVLTDDLRFCKALERAGHEALNFNHIRTAAWSSTQ